VIDCIEFLQKHFEGKTNLGNVKLCFEYHTPDNAWLDVVILDTDRITILEFKSGRTNDKKTLLEHEEQLDAYCIKMSHANVNVWQRFEQGLKARGFLVYTSEKLRRTEFNKAFVKVCDEFSDVVNDLYGSMDDSLEVEVMDFNPDLDRSTLGAFLEVYKGNVLKGVYIPEEGTKRCIEIIDEGGKDCGAAVNIVFVNGKPGSGKPN